MRLYPNTLNPEGEGGGNLFREERTKINEMI